jgi:hypothetical protein
MRLGQIACGDALSLIPTLQNRSVNLCLPMLTKKEMAG